MDKYYVLGNPISHSKSPRIHGLFAQQTGQKINYESQLVRPGDFENVLRDLQARGVKGCNVTVPFKEQAYTWCPQKTPRAKWAQAGNTIRFDAEAGALLENTDGTGLVRDVLQNAGFTLQDKRILLLGAGGAAAGVLGPLLDTQPAALAIANRTSERAVRLVASHRAYVNALASNTRLEALPWAEMATVGAFDVVINATAASLGGEDLALPEHLFLPGALAYDMMYGPPAAGFLDWARGHGAEGRDGLGMLVEQAAESFYFWRGLRPDTAPVLQTLRAELSV